MPKCRNFWRSLLLQLDDVDILFLTHLPLTATAAFLPRVWPLITLAPLSSFRKFSSIVRE